MAALVSGTIKFIESLRYVGLYSDFIYHILFNRKTFVSVFFKKYFLSNYKEISKKKKVY